MSYHIQSLVQDLSRMRKVRGESRSVVKTADFKIKQLGQRLILKFAAFVKRHPELYDVYFKPGNGWIQDINLNVKKQCFRVTMRVLSGDEYSTRIVLIPFLFLLNEEDYADCRKGMLDKISIEQRVTTGLLTIWKAAVASDDTTLSFIIWCKEREKNV